MRLFGWKTKKPAVTEPIQEISEAVQWAKPADSDLVGVMGVIGNGLAEAASETVEVATTSEERMRPDMDLYPPVEGVSFEVWVDVCVALTRNEVPVDQYNSFAETLGVTAGRWKAIDQVWSRRKDSDWKLAARFGSDYQAGMSRKT